MKKIGFLLVAVLLAAGVASAEGPAAAKAVLVNSAGDRQLRITLTTSKDDNASEGNVGLNLYLGASLQQQNVGSRDAQGRFGANVVINSSTPNIYGIQVYNYNNNLTLQYRVNVVGY